MEGKNCIMSIRTITKKKLTDFKSENEDKILSYFKKQRRFVSWDDVICYLIEKK